MSEKRKLFRNKILEVCDNCFRSCCWLGIFMCDESVDAGTVLKTVTELREMRNTNEKLIDNPENEDYWSDETLLKYCGDKAPHGYK